jgi:putative flippase GtrA
MLSGGGEPTRLQVNAANVLSWILAVVFAYITNKLWVFNSVSTELSVLIKEITAFFGARLFSLGFELVWMNTFITLFGARYNTIYKIGAQVGIVIMNYIFSKLFIFKTSGKEN